MPQRCFGVGSPGLRLSLIGTYFVSFQLISPYPTKYPSRMATKANTRSEGWGRAQILIVTLAFIASWALVPTSVLEATWQAEQQQMASWSGSATHD